MSAKIIAEAKIELRSDMSGQVATQSRAFEFNGTKVALDLTDKEADAFDKVFNKYVSKAHSVEVDPSVLRTWARENGHAVGERGRISVDIRNAYLGITDEPADEPAADEASVSE